MSLLDFSPWIPLGTFSILHCMLVLVNASREITRKNWWFMLNSLSDAIQKRVFSLAKISDNTTKKKGLFYFTNLTNIKWHSVTWPYTMTTPYWSDIVPHSTFYRILSGFHRTFATGVACQQGTLTPPDTWSRPFGICICSTSDQSLSELVVILLDYALRISLGTFSISLSTDNVFLPS